MKHKEKKETNQIFAFPEKLILTFLYCFGFFIGISGLNDYFTSEDISVSFSTLAYLTLLLFFLDFPFDLIDVTNPENYLNIKLEAARWLLPGLLTYTAVKTIVITIHRSYKNQAAGKLTNHYAIIGLNSVTINLVEWCRKNKEPYTVICTKEEIENHNNNSITNAIIINHYNTDILNKINIQEVKSLLAITNFDLLNIELTLTAYQFLSERKNQLKCYCRIEDDNLYQSIEDNKIFKIDYENFSATRLSLSSGLSQLVFYRYIFPEILKEQKNELNIGFISDDPFFKNLIIEVIRNLHTGTKTNIHIIGKDTYDSAKLSEISSITSYLKITEHYCNLSIYNLESLQDRLPMLDVLITSTMQSTPGLALINFLIKCRSIKKCIYIKHSDNFNSNIIDFQADSISKFSIASLLNNYDINFLTYTDAIEELAKSIHLTYLYEYASAGEANSSALAWDNLPESLKAANRSQALHLLVKLKVLIPKGSISESAVKSALSIDKLEILSKAEHDRWVVDKLISGWQYTDGNKNSELKLNPNLTSWNDLPDHEKEKDRSTIRNLPKMITKHQKELAELFEY